LWLGWLINYTRIIPSPTKHEITRDAKSQKVNFEWLLNKKWNSIYVEATTASKVMKVPLEKFIFEHYGYY
jgi:hypothetical protein